MAPRPTVYLAGPEVFLPDAAVIGRLKRDLCADHGFEGLFPLDAALDAAAPDFDQRIYAANVALIARSDIAILNLTPFRGASADTGTVFELGLCIGLGKPVFAYTNVADDLLTRLRREGLVGFDTAASSLVDRQGLVVEDFGNVDNLMIDGALRDQGRKIVRTAAADPLRDMAGFVACLEQASAAVPRNGGRRTISTADQKT